MNRLEGNKETLKGIEKLLNDCPSGLEETKATLLQGMLYTLEDISLSLALIADALKEKGGQE